MSSHHQQLSTSSSSRQDGHDNDVSTAIQRHLDIESGGDNPINEVFTIDLSSRSLDSYFTINIEDELKSQLFRTQSQTDQYSIAGASYNVIFQSIGMRYQ